MAYQMAAAAVTLNDIHRLQTFSDYSVEHLSSILHDFN